MNRDGGAASLALAVYRAGTTAFQPFAPVLLRRRAARGREDPARLNERLGRPLLPRPPGPLAWLHGASVGESLSLLPLAEALRSARPDLGLLVTSGTTTAAELLARRLPPGVVHQFTPLDTPAVAARFLDHWRPDLVVFAESELWPNLITGARERGAKLALLSARLSDASARGWARAPRAARRILGAFDLVMAQDDATAGRLAALGAADHGRLNLKLLGSPLPVADGAWAEAEAAGGDHPILLAASTHTGEETLALDAFAPLSRRDALLILVPRHPARGAEVAELSRARGWDTARRSEGAPFGKSRVYVADTLGELGLWFRVAHAAYLGGGHAPGVGGHNPLEPARLWCPTASGPDVDNWREVYRRLVEAEAVAIVPDAHALEAFWRHACFRDPELGRQAVRAEAVAVAQSGALDAAVSRLLALLP